MPPNPADPGPPEGESDAADGGFDGSTTRAITAATNALRPFLKDPEAAPEAVEVVFAIQQQESYSGPIPHPDHLREIEDIVPGAARDLIDMARREQRHRHRREMRELDYPYAGLIVGAIGFATCIAAAVGLALYGHEQVAYAMLGVPVLGVIGWFIKARL